MKIKIAHISLLILASFFCSCEEKIDEDYIFVSNNPFVVLSYDLKTIYQNQEIAVHAYGGSYMFRVYSLTDAEWEITNYPFWITINREKLNENLFGIYFTVNYNPTQFPRHAIITIKTIEAKPRSVNIPIIQQAN